LHIVSVNPYFNAGYNYFQKVFILASTIQKFLTEGNMIVSLILCQNSWNNSETTQCISDFVVRISWHDPIGMLHSSISRTVKQQLERTISRTCATLASSHDTEGRPKRGS
jgi:hypothetical protein